MAGKWGAGLLGVLAFACMLPATASAATIEVTTRTDELDGSPDAKCSVREAVQSANTNDAVGGCKSGSGAADTIKLGRGNYPLTIPSTNEDANANGDLDVEGDKLIFHGTGAGTTTLKTSLADRIVEIHDATPTSFKDLRLSGGDVTSFGTGSGRGGVIAADSGGTLTLTKATVDGGNAYVGGGLYLSANGTGPAKLKVKRSLFIGNHATGLGGALDVVGDVTSKISKSTIYENTVQDPTDSSEGGGVSNRGNKMTITDSNFSGNAAMGSTNHAAAGGGLHNSGPDAELDIRRSLFDFNSASAPTTGFFEGGGAIWSASGSNTVSITNTTFFANTADSPDGQGAVVYLNAGTVILANATLNGNGSASALHAAGGYMLIRNSILQGSNPCFGTVIDSGGYNLASVDDAECDFVGTDDLFGSFDFKSAVPKKNGGVTRTFALKKSSAAVNRIPESFCGVADGEDQRGYTRPADDCDIGAYERKAKPPQS